jgi:cytoskeletal protein RodZ
MRSWPWRRILMFGVPAVVVVVFVIALLTRDDNDDDSADGGDDTEETTSTTSTTTSSTSTTTTTAATTTTTAFDGATTPTSVPSTASAVALLTDVVVEHDSVTFVFRDELPGYEVQYVAPPITEDASGEEVAVGGSAYLHVRMEPASGVDLSGADFEETYTGPTRIAGDGSPIVETVRTGDFEAVLSWVVGLDSQRAFRVEIDGTALRVLFDTP